MKMTTRAVHKYDLLKYIRLSFEGDYALLELFDKDANVKTLEEAAWNVCEKIQSYTNGGVGAYIVYHKRSIDEIPIGYFVYDVNNRLLISFALNKAYRKTYSSVFFENIKSIVGNDFQVYLFSYNERAIKWLQKNGMAIVAKSITVLST